jgi:hypothetical protein
MRQLGLLGEVVSRIDWRDGGLGLDLGLIDGGVVFGVESLLTGLVFLIAQAVGQSVERLDGLLVGLIDRLP